MQGTAASLGALPIIDKAMRVCAHVLHNNESQCLGRLAAGGTVRLLNLGHLLRPLSLATGAI